MHKSRILGQVLNSKQLWKINIFNWFWLSKFVNIAYGSILGPNLPESIILSQDNQFQVLYS